MNCSAEVQKTQTYSVFLQEWTEMLKTDKDKFPSNTKILWLRICLHTTPSKSAN